MEIGLNVCVCACTCSVMFYIRVYADCIKWTKTLTGVVQCIEHQPAYQDISSSIPSQGTSLGCRPGPQLGVWEAIDWCISHTMSVQKVSRHIIWKIESFTEQDARYKKHCIYHNDVSVPFEVGTLGPHTVLPITISCPIIVSWISLMVWNLSFKDDFSFGKKQKSQGIKSGM